MAVLQMQRISICALKKDRKAILEQIQRLGVMEIDPDAGKETELERMDTLSARTGFEKMAALAEQALEVLQRYVPEKVSIFASLEGKKLTDDGIYDKGARFAEYYSKVARQLVGLDKEIAELKASNAKLESQIEGLQPWMELDIPMNFPGTRTTDLILGMIPGEVSLEKIYEILALGAEEKKPAEEGPAESAVSQPDRPKTVWDTDIQILSKDKDYTYLALICRKEDSAAIEEVLRAAGFSRPSLTEGAAPAERKLQYEAEQQENLQAISRCKDRIGDLADRRDDLRLMSDYFRIRAQKYQVLGEIPQTRKTFLISGYIPEKAAEKTRKVLTDRFEAQVEIEDLGEDEEAPVIVQNNGFFEAGEGVMSSFGLPAKGEVDPTSVMTIFYIFLFGLMLSDAAYGLIVMIACGILLKKFPRMSDSMRKSFKLFFWCGVSTLVWGILFGGYFGDVVDVVAKSFFHVTLPEGRSLLPALWFVPLNEPMKMLVYSMLFGVIHLFAGLGMKGYMCLKDKKYMDFLCDVVFWFCLLVGLIIMLLPSDLFASIAQAKIVFPEAVNVAGKALAIGGALGILLFSGRSSKNVGLRLALGAYDLYNITGWLSDVLSYSRLLALGLATGVIASVFNQLGVMLGPVGFVPVFLIGHVLNMAINLLGAYVHTCRLQYVEFFGKFYEGGGRQFHPFRLNTKYVDIKEETKL